VELVQFMGKDNVPFHTVIFPATLLGTQVRQGRVFFVNQMIVLCSCVLEPAGGGEEETGAGQAPARRQQCCS
jgi:hypothetical protein